jgi:hypothetical protein
MPWIDHPSLGHVHIKCSRVSTRRCQFCNTGYAEKLCDFPMNAKGKTCSAGMCNKCATAVGPELDYCPRHKAMTAPQASLF